jgi:hypothetical protein
MNERSIFLEALDQADPTQWSAYLDKACAGDAALRQRVEALLKTHSEAGGFLDKLAPERVAEELGRQPVGEETQGDTPGNDKAGEDLGFLAPADKPDVLGRLGHYDILEVIGRGGMGIVLRAFDEKLLRVVAIKVMAQQLATNATARKRFHREAQAAAAVSHDHVVTIHAVEETTGLPYIAMQYVAGLSLQQRLDRDGPLGLQEILRIGMQTASGLAAAHAQGLVHRDIKPANILLENGVERVKITDFGLARAATEASLTQSGVVAGTPHYMSPEQAEGKTIDQRTDLFSLGSVLYATCTGRAPFRASGTMAVLKRVCEETPTPIRETNPDIPDWLVAIIDKLHAKDPAQRYQSAAEVAELLGRHLAHVQHPSVVPLLPSPPGRGAGGEGRPSARPHRHRWAVAAAVLLLLVGGLSLTEATGVTHLRATVIRIFTPDGTLVVETNDPGVKVTIEGDGGLIITGAGLEEIRLRPGSYKVHAERDGKNVPLERELVSIAKGGREVVKVKLEAPPAPVAAKVEKGAFVLLAAGKERKFDTLAEAVAGASDGDTIEIRGNGPFVTAPIRLGDQALTIRAGAGARPVLRVSPDGARTNEALLTTHAPLVLEGLELQRLGQTGVFWPPPSLLVDVAPLRVANCRFRVGGVDWQYCVFAPHDPAVFRNCEFICPGSSAVLGSQFTDRGWQLAMENCLHVGMAVQFVFYYGPPPGDFGARLLRNTVVCTDGGCGVSVEFGLRPEDVAPSTRKIRYEAEGNLFVARSVLKFNQVDPKLKRLGPAEEAALLPRLIGWHDRGNVYAPGGASVSWGGSRRGAGGPAEWKKYWGRGDAELSEGAVRFQGGNLAARAATAPEGLSPEDFRLLPDSAGYRAGKGGKDVGADVSLVGPGPAYERWKKTPAYQQWLKETGQQK